MAAPAPALVGVDWGTTRLRAALLAADGTVLSRTESASGLMAVSPDGFAPALDAALAALGAGAVPVLMSGMVGSRQGWREAPYVDVPGDEAALAAGIVWLSGTRTPTGIVPGVCTGRTAPPGDVMRGEETEIVGALHALGVSDGTFILPGTHTKWATVESGAITAFETYMTGDTFQALVQHTVLSKTIVDANGDDGAFEQGVAIAADLDGPGDLLNAMFTLRAETLFERLPSQDVSAMLSGLLIGSEVSSALTRHSGAMTIIGAELLSLLYARALGVMSREAHIMTEGCATRGLSTLARRVGLV